VPASVRTEILGAKEAVRALNKIEPGLRKQFTADATRIAQPAIEEAQQRYVQLGVPLSGMARNWQSKGRKLFPYDPRKAVRGLKVKVEGDRRKTSVILLEQRDAGTAIFESAGRANVNTLGDALGPLKPNHTRILGPSLFKRSHEVTGEMEKAVLAIVDRVNKELR
jgi:hypothetical protein